MEAHLLDDHGHIPQLDGPDQELYVFPDPPSYSENKVRTATYAFNKNKQMREIKKDAKIADFEVNVNNNDENCTIKC